MKKLYFFIITLFHLSGFADIQDITTNTQTTDSKPSNVQSLFGNYLSDMWNYELATIQNSSINISNVIIAIIFLLIGLIIAKKLSRIFKKKLIRTFDINQNSINSIEKFIQYSLITVVILTSLDIANVPLSGLTFVGGALAIGIGFGSQNILNNFISGLILMIESPIKVGDIVEIDNKMAEVVNIGARCVHLSTFDNIDLMVPNSSIIQDKITNWTLNDRIVRFKASYYVSVEIDPKKVLKLLEEILSKNKYFDRTYQSAAFIDRIEPYGVKYDIYYFIRVGETIDRKFILNDLNLNVLEVFNKEKIQLSDAKTIALLDTQEP
jgi:small-conductance mechanosensitive channel